MGTPTSAGSIVASGSAGAASTLTSFASLVLTQAANITAAGIVADVNNLWPVQSPGTPQRISVAGDPDVEASFHRLLTQGQFHEASLGEAISRITSKKLDLDEYILQYLDMHRISIDSQLPFFPRVPKMVLNCIHFIERVKKLISKQLGLIAALQADVTLLLAVQTRMLSMIDANISALANQLSEICNWGLPSRPSFPVLLGGLYSFPGFNLNSYRGYSFQVGLAFNFNQTFALCQPLTGLPSNAFLNTDPSSLSSDGIAYQKSPIAAQAGGNYADPAQYTDPSYIAQLQATTIPVYDPSLPTTSQLSLPAASLIVSNYALSPALYAENICSLCSDLNPVIIQPTDTDYIGGASLSRLNTLRGLLSQFINLGNIVASAYDPNIVASWLFYIEANRAGRAGTWIENFSAAYTSLIQPSLDYLNTTPVPYNHVLGGPGVVDAPNAIPLIAQLEADTSGHLLWELSFLEAALLGYTRNVSWDAAADAVYLSSSTGSDIDYAATAVDLTATTTITLGIGTASYPVACAVPQSIATVLNQVIALAAVSIAETPGYQSTRPQFRFVYDEFAQATLVDRYSQFWRVFNDNLVSLLKQDPYLIDFAVTYPEILNAALNPLADPSAFALLESDVASRNRSWTPGSDLIPIPRALNLEGSGNTVSPTDATNGWPNQQLNAATYLARPDVQAQPIPVQIAMLRTNQSYATLAALKALLINTVSSTISNANSITTSVGLPGWQVESNETEIVPPGASGLVLSFPSTILDQTGFVTSAAQITIQATGGYVLNGVFNWDTAGDPGSRSIAVLQNGVEVASTTSDISGNETYTLAISSLLLLNQGDTLEIRAAHSLPEPQTITSTTFLGLADSAAASVAAGVPGLANPLTSSINGATAIFSGTSFPAYTAISIGTDGRAHPINTTIAGTSPFVDGIALNASGAAGEVTQLAVMYGSTFTTTGTSWVGGELLYVANDGTLTQNFASLTGAWVVCVGKALTPTSFIFEPHLPTAK